MCLRTAHTEHSAAPGAPCAPAHLVATHCAACATASADGVPAAGSAPVEAACAATTARRSAWRPVSARRGREEGAGQARWRWGQHSARRGSPRQSSVVGQQRRGAAHQQPPACAARGAQSAHWRPCPAAAPAARGPAAPPAAGFGRDSGELWARGMRVRMPSCPSSGLGGLDRPETSRLPTSATDGMSSACCCSRGASGSRHTCRGRARGHEGGWGAARLRPAQPSACRQEAARRPSVGPAALAPHLVVAERQRDLHGHGAHVAGLRALVRRRQPAHHHAWHGSRQGWGHAPGASRRARHRWHCG